MGQDDSLQPWTIATVVSVSVLALVAVGLRMLARYEKKQTLWWDDRLILISMGWHLINIPLVIGMIKCGMGIHAVHVRPSNIVTLAKLLLVAEIFYSLILVWTKLSLLFMYYRIFRFPYFKKWAYIIGCSIILWAICLIFLVIFVCVPVQKQWYPELPGHCISQLGIWISGATSTIVTDIAILILPMPHLWKLQLRKSEKIALICVFSLGFFVVFASAYRFVVLFSYDSNDPTYTLARTTGWSYIEAAIGITSACLPTLRPAIQFILRSLGVKNSISLFRASADGSQSAGISQTATNRASQIHHQSFSQKGNGPFVRLEEEQSTAENTDPKLRPEDGCIYTVTSESRKGEGDSLSGDEIPLKGIIIKKDFTQVYS